MIIKTVDEGVRYDLGQIVVSREVFGQKNQVVAPVVFVALVETAPLGYVDLASENRFDSLLLGRVVKLFDTVHVAVVGYGQRCHAELFGPLDQRLDGGGSVQYRILRVYVQMCKLAHNLVAYRKSCLQS